MSAPVTRNLTILLTDIKGFTDKTSHKSRSEIQQMLDRHKEIVLPILRGKGGTLVKTIGDAFLMTFESPTDAVLAGVEAQEALRRHNAGQAPEDRIEIRVAINTGEVNLSDNDVFGEPVNITARIEAIAEANEVFFTDAVYLAMNKKEVPSSEVGLLQLKGIPEKVRVYKVKREVPVEGGAQPAAAAQSFWKTVNPLAESPAAGAPAPTVKGRPKTWRRLAALIVDAALCGMVIGLFWPGDSTRVWVKKHRASAARAAGAGAGAGAGSGEVIHFGADGIKVEDPDGRIELGRGGVKIFGNPLKMDAEDFGGEEDDGRWVVRKTRHQKDLSFPLVWFVYSILFIKALGTTPGGRIFKLAVVPAAGAGALDRRQNLLRAFFSLISGYCLMLGYIWALFQRDGRGWHDLMAGTRVVSVE